MKKGTVVTEDQIKWALVIQPEAWAAGQQWAEAMRQNGKEVTEEQIENRARNAQDRDDIRRFVNGGNLSGKEHKTMSRSELVAEINRQMQDGLYRGRNGNDRKAGLRALKRAYGTEGAENRLHELTGKSYKLQS